MDENGKTLRDYDISIDNDELIILDENGNLWQYQPNNPESQRVQETLFKEKQKLIENCLFGVDINPNSVKICRLRLWIELLKNAYYKTNSPYLGGGVEDDGGNSYSKQKQSQLEGGKSRTLQTLPNIDINIKCGNSLISRFDLKADLKKSLKKSKWDIQSYKLAISSYQNATSKSQKYEFEKLIGDIKKDFETEISSQHPLNQKKKQYEEELRNSQESLFELGVEASQKLGIRQYWLGVEIASLTQKIEDIKNNKIYRNSFEWRFEFPQVLDENGDFVGFDLVIGNPPYIGINHFSQVEKEYFKNSYLDTFAATGDIYGLFYELGWNLIKIQGRLSFITSNKWMRAGYGQLLREFFAKKTNPEILLDLGGGVFDNATVDSNLLFYSKDSNQHKTLALKVDKEFFKNPTQTFETINFDHSDGWFIGNSNEINLKKKIESVGKPLKDWDVKINYGIKTGLNEAFIIDENKKNELIAKDPKSAEIIKPILQGRDIKRYGYEFANLYVINTHNGYVAKTSSLHNGKQGLSSTKIPPININDYPAIKEHLDQFEPGLSKRGDKGKTPYNLRNCAYLDEFEKEKIIWTDIATKPTFTWSSDNIYFNNTCYMIVGSTKWHLGVLNSKLIEYIFPLIASDLGEKGNRYFKQFVEQLPIPVLDTPHKQQLATQIETLVDQILELKGENPNADITDQEQRIDKLVFELYGLTSEEIGVVLQK